VKIDELLGIYLEDQPHKLSTNGLQPIEYNIIALRYANYFLLNFFLLSETKKKYQQKRMLIFDKWKDFPEKSPFDWFFRMRGIVFASFSSIFWLCKQMAKKIVFNFFIKSRQC